MQITLLYIVQHIYTMIWCNIIIGSCDCFLSQGIAYSLTYSLREKNKGTGSRIKCIDTDLNLATVMGKLQNIIHHSQIEYNRLN